jgi:TP901 family phage tail tape measure protein
MDKIKFGIEIGATVSSSLKSSIGAAYKSIDGLKDKVNLLNTQRVSLRKINTESSKAELKKVNKQLLQLKKDAIIKIKLEAKKQELLDQKNAILGLLGSAMVISAPISARLNVEKAQGDIASLGIDEKGIGLITEAGRKFSNEFAGTTTPDFIRASYDIKSGIASLTDEGVAQFTRLSAMTATATKATTAEMTKLFALGHGIYRDQFDSDFEFGEKFSSAISASVQAFRTDGADLSAGLSTLGATATKMGVSLAEQLSILGNSKGAFNSSSEAATSYRAFLNGVGKAQEKLGLQFTDSEGKMLPMTQILQKLQDEFGDLSKVETMDEITKAFGSTEATKMITALIDKNKELEQSQKDISKAMEEGTTLTQKMAEARQSGRGFELLGQQIGNLGASIGKIFMPAAALLASTIGVVVTGLDAFINEFPVISSVVGGVALGIFGLVAAIKIATISKTLFQMATITLRGSLLAQVPLLNTLRLSFNRLSLAKIRTTIQTTAMTAKNWIALASQKALSAGSLVLGTSLKVLGAAVGFVGKTFVWLGRALMANPIGLIIGVIAGGAYLIYSYWEPIKGFFGGLWDSVKSIFNGAWDGIKKAFSFTPIGMLVGAWEPIKGFFGGLWNGVSSIFSGAWDGIKKGLSFTPLGLILSNWEPIKQYFLDLWDGLVGGFLKTFEKIGNVWSDVKSFFGFGGDEEKKDISLGSTKKEEYFKDTQLKEVYKPADIKPVNNRSFTTVENKKTVESSTPGTAYKESVAKKPKEPSKVKQTAAAVMIGSSLVSVPATPGEAATVQPKAKTEMVSQNKTVSSPASYTVQVTFTGDIVVQSKDGKVVESGQLKDNIEEQVRVALARLNDEKKNRSFEDEVI